MAHRNFGLGTLSIAFTVMGIIWGFTFFNVCVGDNILSILGLKAWSNGDTGTHFTAFYSLIFLLPAFWLGMKYKNDFGAKIGKIISATIGIILVLSTLFLTV